MQYLAYGRVPWGARNSIDMSESPARDSGCVHFLPLCFIDEQRRLLHTVSKLEESGARVTKMHDDLFFSHPLLNPTRVVVVVDVTRRMHPETTNGRQAEGKIT